MLGCTGVGKHCSLVNIPNTMYWACSSWPGVDAVAAKCCKELFEMLELQGSVFFFFFLVKYLEMYSKCTRHSWTWSCSYHFQKQKRRNKYPKPGNTMVQFSNGLTWALYDTFLCSYHCVHEDKWEKESHPAATCNFDIRTSRIEEYFSRFMRWSSPLWGCPRVKQLDHTSPFVAALLLSQTYRSSSVLPNCVHPRLYLFKVGHAKLCPLNCCSLWSYCPHSGLLQEVCEKKWYYILKSESQYCAHC